MTQIQCPCCGKVLANLHSVGGHAKHCDVTKEEIFWSRVDKSAGQDACWPWRGVQHFRGYGACSSTYGDTRTHRVAWFYTHGQIPNGLGVLHKCDNPLCVNPAHLYLGDQKQNSEDARARGRLGNCHKPIDQLLHPQLSRRLQR